MSDSQRRQNLLQSHKINGEQPKVISPETKPAWKIRFLFSVVAFLSFYMMEKYDLDFGGITSEKIYETVCNSTKGFDFAIDFPYTLND